MLTDEEIKALLTDIEADNVERTVSTKDTAKFCKAIAIRNDLKDLVLLFILSSGFLSSSFSGVFWYGFGFVLSRVYR